MARVALSVTAGTVALAGCAPSASEVEAGLPPAFAQGPAASATAGGGTGTATTKPNPAATGPALPAGYQWVETGSPGLKFALPSEWQVTTDPLVLEQTKGQVDQELARVLGVPVDRLPTYMDDEIDMIGFRADAAGLRIDGAVQAGWEREPGLPTKAEALQELAILGVKTVKVSEATSKSGRLVLLSYNHRTKNGVVHSRQLAVMVSKRREVVAVSATSAAKADALIADIRKTLTTVK